MQRIKALPIFALLLLGVGLLLNGCNTTAKPDSVTVTVADLKAADATLTETRVIVTLRFTSESVNAFGFSGSAHKLYFNGGYVGKAVSHTPIGVPPLSSVTHDVTMILENAALVKQLLTVQGNPVVKYRLESVLFATAGEEEMKLKSQSEGTINLSGLQSLAR
ncbi:MAG: Water Stress and Hypersensitive response domain protein [Verrucomicrobia bacterium]|nr:Water Stress and Hypersensitive response domain protein [Verrucomicrobiota bacterium]